MSNIRIPGLTAIVFFGLIAAEYIFNALFVAGIGVPGGAVIPRGMYFGIGAIAITVALPAMLLSPSHYGRLLLLLLVLLFVSPIIAGTIFRPDHSDLMPYYLEAAFGSAAFAAFGVLFGRQGLSWVLAAGIWGLMLFFTIPALVEMSSSGFGAATTIAVLALHITQGDHFMMATLLLIAVSERMQTRLIVYVVGFIALAAIGSRTSLYAYVVALPILLLMTSERGSAISLKALGVLASVAAAPIAASYVLVELANTRMFAFFSDVGGDTSVRERVQTLHGGWEDTLASPLAGAFGSDIDRYGRGGYYIHNYLELWRQLGAVPFFLFVGLLLAAIHLSVTRARLVHPNASFTFLLFLGPLLAQIIFSRSYGYPQIFLVLGMAAAVYASRNWAAMRTSPVMLAPLADRRA